MAEFLEFGQIRLDGVGVYQCLCSDGSDPASHCHDWIVHFGVGYLEGIQSYP